MAQKHRDYKTACTTIPIEERVYRLKLRVYESNVDERQNTFFVMEKFLKIT